LVVGECRRPYFAASWAAAVAARDQHHADVVCARTACRATRPETFVPFRHALHCGHALLAALEGNPDITLIAGYRRIRRDKIFNSAHCDSRRAVLPIIAKAFCRISVFEREAYFTPGTEPIWSSSTFETGCWCVKTFWDAYPARQAAPAGAQDPLVINASPYEVDKQHSASRNIARVPVGEAAFRAI